MYKKILVAVNDNQRAFKALAHAIELADCMAATLFIIFVSKREQLDEEAEHLLTIDIEEQKIKDTVKKQFPVIFDKATFIKRDGKNIAAAIVSVADELNIDLIIMGSRRLSGANSVIRRSIANAVISSSVKPVLIV